MLRSAVANDSELIVVSMANYRAIIGVIRSRPRFFNFPVAATRGKPKTEPDLDLIKQVEQVKILILEGLGRRIARIRSIGTTGAIVILVFLI